MSIRKLSIVSISLAALMSLLYGQRPTEEPSWAPKLPPFKYVAPNKPHTKLADLKAKHKGQANWREEIVSDKLLHSDYIYSAPGSKVSKRFHSDTREWWVVMAGKIRFEIEGQEPFVATKGSMVQVPYQTVYSMETIGVSRRSVRNEYRQRAHALSGQRTPQGIGRGLHLRHAAPQARSL
jgi:mannose-6-phosphate isomerase-like protein (cupin superfamily)